MIHVPHYAHLKLRSKTNLKDFDPLTIQESPQVIQCPPDKHGCQSSDSQSVYLDRVAPQSTHVCQGQRSARPVNAVDLQSRVLLGKAPLSHLLIHGLSDVITTVIIGIYQSPSNYPVPVSKFSPKLVIVGEGRKQPRFAGNIMSPCPGNSILQLILCIFQYPIYTSLLLEKTSCKSRLDSRSGSPSIRIRVL